MAAIKVPELVDRLEKEPRVKAVKVIATTNAKFFLQKQNTSPIIIIDDAEEWKHWNQVGDPILHIELRNWADIL